MLQSDQHKGYICKVPPEELEKLPQKSTPKKQIVFDTSASDKRLQRRKPQNELLAVLLHFCYDPVAMNSVSDEETGIELFKQLSQLLLKLIRVF